MPAITTDTAPLPRIDVAPDSRARRIRSVTTAPSGLEGEGFPVRRAFAGVPLTELDPFVHLDQMGEVDYAPGEPKGTPWHPHRGFETVTYMMEGLIRHADSTGGGGLISDGDTQWMTAGKGILHIEAPPEEVVAAGGLFHGLQLWVNLPRADKWLDPQYQELAGSAVPLLSTPDGGALVRLIAGSVGEHAGPGSTHTPMNMVHATLAPGARMVLPWPVEFNALVYILGGHGFVGEERRPVDTGRLTVFGDGDTLVVEAASAQEARMGALDVLVLGGQAIREPVVQYGPFVMNTQDEIKQAFDDFHAGRLGVIPATPKVAPGA